MKKSFSIHSDFYGELENLSAEQRGDLLLALIHAAKDEQPPQMDAVTSILYRLITAQINRFAKHHEENGKKGGAPKGNKNAMKPAVEAKNEDTENNQNNLKQPKQPKTSQPIPFPIP